MTVSTVPFALAVDGDPIILMDICDILEAAGYRCNDADHGDAAKLLLHERAEEFTLLFSDVEMLGQTDGFALARYVAEHWPWIEIVVANGRRSPAPGEMPDRATFLSKPYSAQMVHAHLRERLPDGKQPGALKQPA